MASERTSRRTFLRRNALAGAGALLALNSPLFFPGSSYGREANRRNRSLLYFDALTEVGPRREKHPQVRWSLEHICEELDYCSISGGLVTYTQSLMYDTMHANLELSEMLSEHDHLFPVWNVLPDHSGEFPSTEELGERMRQHDVRAVTLKPNSNGWDWRQSLNQPLLDWLNNEQVLTLSTVGEIGGWSALDEFLGQFPRLPLLISGVAWRQQRYLLPLLESHSNLHITFDRLQINEGIEDLVQRGLTDQLIFGSNTPEMSAGAHRTYIDYAAISDDAREKIAGGNLIRLLGGQEPPRLRENRDADDLMLAAQQGEPLPVPLLDMHMHILDEGLQGTGEHYRMLNGGPQGVFAMMERIGNTGGGIMSWNGVVSADMEGGFRSVEAALDEAPEGYWGLATFDPIHYSQEELKQRVREVYSDRRLIGMKPYPFYGVEYHDPLYDFWWEYGAERDFYALIHRSRNDGLEVETLAERYPNVRWVIAHAGGSFPWAEIAIQAMKKFDNVYAELTFTSVPLGIIEYMIDEVGDDRIVYGSDLPMRDPRQQLGWVLYARLPEATKRKILALNAYDVVRPCLDRLPQHHRPRV
jgi:predicted TIM-barrel fold metal-dependent hydrolase